MTDIQHPTREKMFRQLVAIAKADGTMEEREATVLRSLGNRFGFSAEKIEAMFGETISMPVFAIINTSERFSHLMNVFRIAIADGVIKDKEIESIKKLMIALGYPQDHSEELIELAIKQVS